MPDHDHVASLLTMLAASPSPYHAVDTLSARLQAAGFRRMHESDPWTDVTGRCWVIRSGALIAWDATDPQPSSAGFHIIGAHTDSPNLRIKPNAAASNFGYRQIAVEIYGGALNNSWLDRDLGISGRLILADGSIALVKVDRAIARVTQLAIHLDREVNEKGVILDKQLHVLPIAGLGSHEGNAFETWIAGQAGVDPSAVQAHDLMFHDLTPPGLLGLDQEFVVSARIDNLFSCWAAVEAICAQPAPTDGRIAMVALFDHEEVGSSSTTGAGGPLLEIVISRINAALGLDADRAARAMNASSCVSSDMAHAVHPNYADRHEPGHRPVPNAGPVLKVNANQRYATSAIGAARFRAACALVDVPVQTFVSRNSQPCGSTIGPITATRLGIETIDVGCAMLSMHSARELCGAADVELYLRALTSYLHA
jgi:aspartyl aminopeptidase